MLRAKTDQRLKDGHAALVEWWKNGFEPVAIEEAQSRAEICFRCPMNESDAKFERLTSLAAKLIREGLEWKTHRSLHVQGEEKLNVCSACGCELKLKVFAPIGIARMAQADYPKHCWVPE